MPAAVRKVRKPRPDFNSSVLPGVAIKGLDLLRVHSKDYPAIGFRTVPTHRFSHPDSPGGLLYLGESVSTCLWECFGDDLLDTRARLAAARWENSHLSKVRSKSTFRICNLADEKVRLGLGLDLGTLMNPELAVTQEWALAIQNHPSAVDGLRYLSRFNSEPSLVLFERPGIAAKLAETLIGPLPDVDEATQVLAQRSISLI